MPALPLDPPEMPLTGTVVAVQANFYWVQLDGTWAFQRLLCTRRSRLKKIGQQVMVGDRVGIAEPDWQGQRGAISEIFSRSSSLDRPPVANATRILLVFSLARPTLDLHQLNRFLVKAESTELEVCLCLNKRDLVDDPTLSEWQQTLAAWGYGDALWVSVQQGWALDQLRDRLTEGMTIVAGPSGVGKSSAINALIPETTLRVGAVSGKLERGRHTTRHVELFTLPSGGMIADTPGFNQPTLSCLPEALGGYFPEIRDRLAGGDRCHYADCLHRDEPGCQVRGDWPRYALYLTLLDEAIAYRDQQRATPDSEAALKRKTHRDGHATYEPRLETKKYRRQSRRSQHQILEAIDLNQALADDDFNDHHEDIGDPPQNLNA